MKELRWGAGLVIESKSGRQFCGEKGTERGGWRQREAITVTGDRAGGNGVGGKGRPESGTLMSNGTPLGEAGCPPKLLTCRHGLPAPAQLPPNSLAPGKY